MQGQKWQQCWTILLCSFFFGKEFFDWTSFSMFGNLQFEFCLVWSWYFFHVCVGICTGKLFASPVCHAFWYKLACAWAHRSAYCRVGRQHGIALVKALYFWGPIGGVATWTKWVQYWSIWEPCTQSCCLEPVLQEWPHSTAAFLILWGLQGPSFFLSALSSLSLCVVLCFKSCAFGKLMCRLCRVVRYE